MALPDPFGSPTGLNTGPDPSLLYNPKRPQSTFGWAIDVLSRPLYGVTGAISQLTEGLANRDSPGRLLSDVLHRVGQDVFTGRSTRTSGFDLISELDPAFAQERPWTAKTLGFAAEVLIDPLNLIGTGPVTKVFNYAGKATKLRRSKALLGALEQWADDSVELFKGNRQVAQEQAFKLLAEGIDPSLPSVGSKAFEANVGLRAEKDLKAGFFQLEEEYPHLIPSYDEATQKLPRALRTPLKKGTDAQEAAREASFYSIPKNEVAVDGIGKGITVRPTDEGLVVTYSRRLGSRDVEVVLAPVEQLEKNAGQGLLDLGTRTPQAEWRISTVRAREGFEGAPQGFDTILSALNKDPNFRSAVRRFEPVESSLEEVVGARQAGVAPGRGRDFRVEKAIKEAPYEIKQVYQRRLMEQAMEDQLPVGELAYRALRKENVLKDVRSKLAAEYREVLDRKRDLFKFIEEKTGLTVEDLRQRDPKFGFHIGERQLAFATVALGLGRAARSVGEAIPGVKKLEEGLAPVVEAISKFATRGKAIFSQKAQFAIEAKKRGIMGSFEQVRDVGRRLEQSLATGVRMNAREGAPLEGLGQGGMREKAARWTIEMFGGSEAIGKMGPDAHKRMTEALFKADAELEAAVARARSEKARLLRRTDDQIKLTAADLRGDDFQAAINKAFTEANLTDQERGVLATFYQHRRDLGGIQLSGELLKDALQAESLAPGFFADPNRILRVSRQGKAAGLLEMARHQPDLLAERLGVESLVDASLIERLASEGIDIGESAIKIIMLRMQDALRTEQLDLAKATLTEVFGKDVLGLPGAAKTGLASVRRLFRDLGYWQYEDNPAESLRLMADTYDGFLGLFRKTTTILRPAFAARQLVGNAIQQMAAGTFSIAGYAAATNYLLTGKFGKFTSPFGKGVLAEDIIRWQREFPILRGITAEGLTGSAAPTRYEMLLAENWSQLGTKDVTTHSKDMMQRLIRYTNWSGLIEDQARLAGFLTNIGKGMEPKAAFDAMEAALFDYTTGLTRVERDVFRRLLPFYSFNRFATGLLLKLGHENPARLVRLDRAWGPIEASWAKLTGGDQEPLTDTERRIIPGFLLDQPSSFAGFSEQMKAKFNTFRGFHFGDVLDVVQLGSDGQIDVEETLQKGWFAQMSPFLKWPIERAARAEMFTGRSFDKMRAVGPVEADEVLAGLTGALVATLAQTPTGQTAGTLFAGLSAATDGWIAPNATAEQVLKAVLGWEEGINPQTGEPTVFVSPTKAHFFATIFPPLNDVLFLSRDDRTPVQKTLRLLGGVNTSEVDLRNAQQWAIKDLMEKPNETKTKLREALRQGRASAAERERERLAEAYAILSAELPTAAGPVRGAQVGPGSGLP